MRGSKIIALITLASFLFGFVSPVDWNRYQGVEEVHESYLNHYLSAPVNWEEKMNAVNQYYNEVLNSSDLFFSKWFEQKYAATWSKLLAKEIFDQTSEQFFYTWMVEPPQWSEIPSAQTILSQFCDAVIAYGKELPLSSHLLSKELSDEVKALLTENNETLLNTIQPLLSMTEKAGESNPIDDSEYQKNQEQINQWRQKAIDSVQQFQLAQRFQLEKLRNSFLEGNGENSFLTQSEKDILQEGIQSYLNQRNQEAKEMLASFENVYVQLNQSKTQWEEKMSSLYSTQKELWKEFEISVTQENKLALEKLKKLLDESNNLFFICDTQLNENEKGIKNCLDTERKSLMELFSVYNYDNNINFFEGVESQIHLLDSDPAKKEKAIALLAKIDDLNNQLKSVRKKREETFSRWMQGDSIESFYSNSYLSPETLMEAYIKNQKENYSKLITIFQKATKEEENPEAVLEEAIQYYGSRSNSSSGDFGDAFERMIPSILKQVMAILKQNESMVKDPGLAKERKKLFLRTILTTYQTDLTQVPFSPSLGESFSKRVEQDTMLWISEGKKEEAILFFKAQVQAAKQFLECTLAERKNDFKNSYKNCFANCTTAELKKEESIGSNLRNQLIQNSPFKAGFSQETSVDWVKRNLKDEHFVKRLQKFAALAQFIGENRKSSSSQKQDQQINLESFLGANIFNEYEKNFNSNLASRFRDEIYAEACSVLEDPDFNLFYSLMENNLLKVDFDRLAKVYFREKIFPLLKADRDALHAEVEEYKRYSLIGLVGVVVSPIIASIYGAKKFKLEKLETVIESCLENFCSLEEKGVLFKNSFESAKKDLREQIDLYSKNTGIFVARDHLIYQMEGGNFEIWKLFTPLYENKEIGLDNTESGLYKSVKHFQQMCEGFHRRNKQFDDSNQYLQMNLYDHINQTLDSEGDELVLRLKTLILADHRQEVAEKNNSLLEKVGAFDSLAKLMEWVSKNSLTTPLSLEQKNLLVTFCKEKSIEFLEGESCEAFLKKITIACEQSSQSLEKKVSDEIDSVWTDPKSSIKDWLLDLFPKMSDEQLKKMGLIFTKKGVSQAIDFKKQYLNRMNHFSVQFQQKNMQWWVEAFQTAYQEGINEWEKSFSEIATIQNQWAVQFMETANAVEKELTDPNLVSLVALKETSQSHSLFNELSAQALSSVKGILSDSIPSCNLKIIDEFQFVSDQNEPVLQDAFLSDLVLNLKSEYTVIKKRYEESYLESVKEKSRIQFIRNWQSLREMIEQRDKAAGNSLTSQLIQNGFKKEKESYSRQTVTGMVIGGAVLENQKIADYKHFDLSPYSLEFSNAEFDSIREINQLQEIDKKESEKMEKILVEIFGNRNLEMKKLEKEGTYREIRKKNASEFFNPTELNTKLESESSEMGGTVTVVKSGSTLKGLDALTAYEVEHKISRSYYAYGGKFGTHFGHQGELNPTLDWAGLVSKMDQQKLSFSLENLHRVAFIKDLEGSGESGRILGDLAILNLKENRGLTQFSTRPWDLRMWDDDWDFFKAPTLRDTIDVVISAIGAIASGGTMPWIGFALKAASDLTFAIADTAVAQSEAEKGKTWINFFSKTAVSALSLGLSSATAGATTHIANAIEKGAADWGLSVVESLVPTLVSGATSGVVVKNGALAWDSSLAIDHFFGKQQLASFTSSLISSGVKNGLGLLESTGKINTEGYFKNDLKNIKDINNFVSASAGLAVSSAMTQSADISILNLSDFFVGQEESLPFATPQSGLLSIHLEKGNHSMKISKAGTGLNLSNWVGFGKGALLYDEMNRISKNDNEVFKKNQNAIRALASSARGSHWNLSKKAKINQLINGEIDLKMSDSKDFVAQTVLDNNQILVNLTQKVAEGKDILDDYFLAVVLAHELERDGIFSSSADNFKETVDSVKSHIDIAEYIAKNDPQFIGRHAHLFREIEESGGGEKHFDDEAFKKFVMENYDSDADYWRMKNGSLERDGEGNLYFKDNETAALTINALEAQSLIKLLGKDRAFEYLGIKKQTNLAASDLSERYLKEKLELTASEITDLREGNKNVLLEKKGFVLKEGNDGKKCWTINNDYNDIFQECLGSKVIAKMEQNGKNNIQIRQGYTDDIFYSALKMNSEGEYYKYKAMTRLERSTKSFLAKQGIVTDKVAEDRGKDSFGFIFQNIENFNDTISFNVENVQSVDVYNQVQTRKIADNDIKNEEILENLHLTEEQKEKLEKGESVSTLYQRKGGSAFEWKESKCIIQLVDGEYQVIEKKNFACINRDQKTASGLQGNTVVSNFDVTFGGVKEKGNGELQSNSSKDYTFFLNNFFTADGDYVNKYGIDGEPGGRWLIHSDRGLNSDGCFIAQEEALKNCFDAMRNFGLTNAFAGITFSGELVYKDSSFSQNSYTAQFFNDQVQKLNLEKELENPNRYRKREVLIDRFLPGFNFPYSKFLESY